jgi:hypothetical protein
VVVGWGAAPEELAEGRLDAVPPDAAKERKWLGGSRGDWPDLLYLFLS